uniref:Retrotransposon Copia-like N-terminal domain-containing protein n=1 Tax=Fagus sylvatica TaxID=28930 RepID=A0A2N9EFQ8_FAGSY
MSSSSSSSSSSCILSAPSQNTSTHSLTPIQHLITIKLNRDNYLLWKAQIVPYLKGQHLFGFIDGSLPSPPSILSLPSTDVAQPLLNPAFLTWQSQDQMILSALISSLFETILAYMVKCTTSRVKSGLPLSGDSSIADYYHCFTHLIDTLVAIDQPLPHHKSLSFLLAGLGADYDSLVTSVQTQLTPIALEDLYSHLLSHELRLSHNEPSVDLSTASVNFVNKNSSTRGGHGGRNSNNFSINQGCNNFQKQRGRGRGRSNFSNSSNKHFCQVCQKPRHVALQCYHRFDNTYQYDNNPQMQALLVTPQQTTDPNWYPDSGATHHVTSDLANLNVHVDEYQGSEQIRVGERYKSSHSSHWDNPTFNPHYHFSFK